MSVPAAPLEFPASFTDDTRFLQQALNEYLEANFLPLLMFYELSAAAQEGVLARAQQLKRRSKG
jgi:hypothetical protein